MQKMTQQRKQPPSGRSTVVSQVPGRAASRALAIPVAALLVAACLSSWAATRAMAQETPGMGHVTLRLEKSEMPRSQVLSGWLMMSAGVLHDEDQRGVENYFKDYGLDVSSPAVQELAEVQDRYVERFRPSKLHERYEQSDEPDAAVRRQWMIDRARFFGEETGRWFRDLEAEGVDVDALTETILNGHHFGLSEAIADETPDFEGMHFAAAAFEAALRKSLGRTMITKRGVE